MSTKKKRDVKCSQSSVEVKELEKQIDEFLSSIQLNEKYLKWSIKHLRAQNELEASNRELIQEKQQKAHNEVTRSLKGLLDMRLREKLTEDEYKEKKRELTDKRNNLQSVLNDLDKEQDRWLELSEKTFEFATYARYWFANGDLKTKRQILSSLGQNLVLKDKKINIEPAKPFKLIQDALELVPEAREGFEHEKVGSIKGKGASLDTPNPVLLRG